MSDNVCDVDSLERLIGHQRELLLLSLKDLKAKNGIEERFSTLQRVTEKQTKDWESEKLCYRALVRQLKRDLVAACGDASGKEMELVNVNKLYKKSSVELVTANTRIACLEKQLEAYRDLQVQQLAELKLRGNSSIPVEPT
eukprot:GEMP01042122.1.p1 GENE.GEMP01042122.1~~GEMP01042122.1.p1  ORF type:complete len:141 (+),score=37.96 GEMP01042122.1:43-465(+)